MAYGVKIFKKIKNIENMDFTINPLLIILLNIYDTSEAVPTEVFPKFFLEFEVSSKNIYLL